MTEKVYKHVATIPEDDDWVWIDSYEMMTPEQWEFLGRVKDEGGFKKLCALLGVPVDDKLKGS